jgi:hypothetical protein
MRSKYCLIRGKPLPRLNVFANVTKKRDIAALYEVGLKALGQYYLSNASAHVAKSTLWGALVRHGRSSSASKMARSTWAWITARTAPGRGGTDTCCT